VGPPSGPHRPRPTPRRIVAAAADRIHGFDRRIAAPDKRLRAEAEALARLRSGLAQVEAAGVVTNAGFLGRLLADVDVAAGQVDTGLIARRGAALAADPAPEAMDHALAALGALGLGDAGGPDPWAARDGWRAWGRGMAAARFEDGEVLLRSAEDGWAAETPAGAAVVEASAGPDGALAVQIDGRRMVARVVCDGLRVTVLRAGRAHRFTMADPLAADDVQGGAAEDAVRAPMPGVVKAVHVAPGAAVAAGDRLATLEAMKMEHALRAPRDGVVEIVAAVEGAQVEEGALLVALAPG
jgi:3-methylcrotonyl-CoA carboxylase alpha subunit